MNQRLFSIAAIVSIVILWQTPLSADWPPGPRFQSIGRFVESVSGTPYKPHIRAPALSPGDYTCPDVEGGQSWRLGGLASGLSPSVIAATPDGLEIESGDTGELSQTALDLVAALPGFMRDDFLLRLSQISIDFQEQIAELLASLPSKHLDEAAFLVAHLSLKDLTSDDFDPWLLMETPAHIYEAGEAGMKLGHSTLMEKTSEDGGVDWTTVRLKVETEPGVFTETEVPPDVYYWYVVHPKLDMEPVQLTVPHTGKAGPHPEGATWREYYLFTPEEVAQYTEHFLFRHPDPVTGAEIQGWGPSAATVFSGLDVGPLELVRTQTGLAMIEFRIGKGTILATTMPLEKAAAGDESHLLTNCLYYGNGNDPTIASLPHLLVMDHKPYGNNALTLALDDLDIKYDIKTGAEFSGLDLQPYTKMIVPSDQPLALYEAMAARKDDIEEWIKTGRVFELHGATSAMDDWSGIDMPGGFTIEPLDGSWASDAVEIGGWPHLAEVIPATDLLWDGQVYGGLSGDRFHDPDTFALDKTGWFTSQNLFDNIAEYSGKHPFMFTERSLQAVRILYNHFGNCGELQDVVTAAARTALIPMMNVSNSNEDHVWNEFYSPLDGEWRTFQVSWSDGVTIIDHQKGAAEKLTGGGKDISMVQAHRGDGYMINRTSKYSDTWLLTLDVTDSAGRPVDGAMVFVASETYYPDESGQYPLSIGYYGHTDLDGRFSAELGDAQNFYVRVISPLGTYPVEDNKVVQVASVEEAVAGKEIDLSAALAEEADTTVPGLPAQAPAVLQDREWLEVELASNGKYLRGTNPMSGDTFNEPLGDGTFDVYVLDEEGLAAWKAGDPVEALWGASGIGADAARLCGPSPAQGKAYVVVAAPEHLGTGTAFNGTLTLHSGPDETDAEPADVISPDIPSTDNIPDTTTQADVLEPSRNGSDCSAGHTGIPPAGVFLLLLMAFLWMRIPARRRGKTP